MADFERAAKVSGARFVYLTKDGALLERINELHDYETYNSTWLHRNDDTSISECRYYVWYRSTS